MVALLKIFSGHISGVLSLLIISDEIFISGIPERLLYGILIKTKEFIKLIRINKNIHLFGLFAKHPKIFWLVVEFKKNLLFHN